MKTLAELDAIREKMQSKVCIRRGEGATKIVVGMATCGIAAGARDVLHAFVEDISENGLTERVTVTQMGCIGLCEKEPVVEVYESDKKVTYVEMTAEKAKRVVKEHIMGGKVVEEYTIDNADK